MKTKTMISLLTLVAAVSAASSQYEEQLSIHTLAPRDRGAGIHVADALLSDWEGDHWVSLDADLDKVSLSWTTDAEHITFQVSKGISQIESCNHYVPTECMRLNKISACR